MQKRKILNGYVSTKHAIQLILEMAFVRVKAFFSSLQSISKSLAEVLSEKTLVLRLHPFLKLYLNFAIPKLSSVGYMPSAFGGCICKHACVCARVRVCIV